MGGIIVALVVALAVTVTVLVMRTDSDAPTPADGGDSEFASAGDTGPVSIITEDPTCDAWGRVGRDYASSLGRVNWDTRDRSLPAAAWTAPQASMYEAAQSAMTAASNQANNLSRQTPHRVMRKLYLQFNAYTTEFSKRIPDYQPDDDDFIAVSDAIGSALSNICSSVSFGSAKSVAPLVPAANPPTKVDEQIDGGPSQVFLDQLVPACSEWETAAQEFSDETAAWLAIDPAISAADWTPQQRSINDAVVPIMTESADEVEELSRRSENSTFEDFGVLAAQYRRAFALAVPSYTAADGFLSQSAAFLVKTVVWACKAVE
ncbi:hypothetical protein [Mycolicibacterium sp. F2034L]|uniref:hypothetical protein n=1 Tax=Mycolicibacterium sp. F2034L TaxID=2926422 RepID=UPI001FF10275|nr:hypothetical protein [Mycolicibacterium sp. F2034L]MCK0174363.1 hypothetical protein [Mycolicibacterium sp. F2034L]